MTLHKLSAGSGYEYLTRQVAAMDSTEKGHATLADYYSAKGEAPGVWMGSGLAGIDGIETGDVVTAEQMLHLFGHGLDPVSGDRLGRPYRLYDNQLSEGFRAEVGLRARFLSSENEHSAPASPADVRARARTEVAKEFFVEEHGREPTNPRELDAALKRYSRPPRAAVAGFDLTFSPVKSVSTLWAIAPPEVSAVIEKAHDAAVSDALRFIEREALFTREGLNGARQVETRGLIATGFTHRDSRAGDPDLHTHVAVANKVQTTGGKWLAIYGRVLYEAAVAASETYNTALEHHLAATLGVRFAPRSDAQRGKRLVREIVGINPSLNQEWSKRRRDINVRQGELAADFQQTHGRPPTPLETIGLAQQANLETRDAKHEPRSLAEQRSVWHDEAVNKLGSQQAADDMVAEALHPIATVCDGVSATWVADTAQRVVAELESHRATWKTTHARAEAQRQVRDTEIDSGRLDAAVGWVVNHVLEHLSVNLTPDLDPISDPEKLRRADGSSVYRHTGHDLFTSPRILEAEQQIMIAADREDGRLVPVETVEVALLESAANGIALNQGQAQLVREMALSGRRLQVGIAAAGSGKTTAMQILASAWDDAGGQVVGLAPSAAAAAALGAETGITSDTLAKLVHELDVGSPSPLLSIGPETLVIIDEAGMADTLTLARVINHAIDNGASVRLIGDDQQLAAIGAGGVLRDIVAIHGAARLDQLMRFTDAAEAAASIALRHGNPSALGYYFDQDRVHIGSTTTTTDAVFAAWSKDRAAGMDSLMVAPTHDLVTELNLRARATRLDKTTPDAEVDLADGSRASIGDTMRTRRNDRRLALSPTDWVKNGDRWTVTDVQGGSLTARHARSGLHITLPAPYVAEHVELGYASTVHSAQGLTADTMHGVITGTESRETLYSMMTRGRHANHVHLAVGGDGDPHQLLHPDTREPATATEILESILARTGTAVSATTTAREATSPAAQLNEAATRYADALVAAAEDVLGPDHIRKIADQAEELLTGLTGTPGWSSLSAQLLMIETNGLSACDLLETAFAYRPLDDADDAALVLGWRLHTLASTDGGPLPWLPAIPAKLTEDSTWGTYLVERAEQVSTFARNVRRSTDQHSHQWLPPNTALPAGLTSDIEVWRAAHGIPESDLRPTGLPQVDFAAREHQQRLDQSLTHHLDKQGAAWLRPISELVGHSDNHTPVLAGRLALLAQQGHDVHRLLEAAAGQGSLPDDHPTAALDSRITRLLAGESHVFDRVQRQRTSSPRRSTDLPPGGPGVGI
ncbi:MobF family relaxase [Aeromicrobium sp. Root344]|uniref:MobF family relaxase n=1 Tax=Aeromicrobium sp. Root344 TaxID=1736521 RepID=UPI000A73EF12|nr:MobF family relaxase [Aeromicrobium sp. Root344]